MDGGRPPLHYFFTSTVPSVETELTCISDCQNPSQSSYVNLIFRVRVRGGRTSYAANRNQMTGSWKVPANIPATVVQQSETGIQWGRGIQGQGLPFESYLEGVLPANTRLPPNFPTIDFFDANTGVATSAKTLDTMTAAKVVDPTQVYSSLKSNVDALANFEGGTLSKATVNSAEITTRDLQVAIPVGTTPAQWTQIQKAVNYANSQGVNLKITVTH